MMMRARLACGCMMPTHCCVRLVEADISEGQVELAGLDLRQIEQVVEQRHQMHAGGVDILDVIPIALVAERAEAFRRDHLGKTGDCVERRADFVTDFADKLGFGRGRFLRLAGGVPQLVFAALLRFKPDSEFANFALGSRQRKRTGAAALFRHAIGENERERGCLAERDGEQSALDRAAFAVTGHHR